MVEIVSIVTDGLGHTSQAVDPGDGRGVVIDPARLPTERRRLEAVRGLTTAWTAVGR